MPSHRARLLKAHASMAAPQQICETAQRSAECPDCSTLLQDSTV